MASITAEAVKRLRSLTGAGMMECKKALTEAEGNVEKAVELLRISGAARAAKRGADRTAGNGVVANSGNALFELRCETDFVAKSGDFVTLSREIAALVDSRRPSTDHELAAANLPTGETVAEAVAHLSGIIGEKLEAGRFAYLDGTVSVYMHSRSAGLPPVVGVLVSYEGAPEGAKDAALQIAAMRPKYLDRESVPAEIVANERRIAEATAREEGKPPQALPRIVEGRLSGFFKDVTLLDQPFVQDSKKSVATWLAESGTTVTGFARIEAGQA